MNAQAVMEDARAQQASAMSELEWQGRQLPVRSSKTRMCILRAQELEKEFQSTSTPLTNERKLTHYDKIFVAYQDAKKGVRDDLMAHASRISLQLTKRNSLGWSLPGSQLRRKR